MGNKNYLAVVWEQGKRDTKEYYRTDRRSWVFNIGSALIVAIISPIIYVALGLIMADHLGLSIVAGIVSGLVFLGLWFLGVFVYHLFRLTSIDLQLEDAVEAILLNTRANGGTTA